MSLQTIETRGREGPQRTRPQDARDEERAAPRGAISGRASGFLPRTGFVRSPDTPLTGAAEAAPDPEKFFYQSPSFLPFFFCSYTAHLAHQLQ